MLRLTALLTGLILTSPANAHLGHVGEVAGHAHWIGIGAVIVAGALAAAVGKLTEKENDSEENEDDNELGEEASAEG